MNKLKNLWKELISGFRGKQAKAGSYSIAVTCVVIIIAILLNLIVSALPASITRLDTTSNKLYSFSDETKELAADLDTKVEVYHIVTSGSEDYTLKEFLDSYCAQSSNIKLSTVDPEEYPTFTQAYTTSGISDNSLIVVCGERSVYVDYDEIYTYTYDSSYNYTTSFDGEGQLTSAIEYVTSEVLPKAYVLTGHGDTGLTSDLENSIKRQNFTIEELSLLTEGTVPEDADTVILAGPTSDISELEYKALTEYLDAGGSMMVFLTVADEGVERPNTTQLLADYGMELVEGIVIEQNTGNYYTGAPFYLLPNIQYHEITEPLYNAGWYILLPVSCGMTISEETEEGLTVESLLNTSDSAFVKPAGYGIESYELEDGDIEGGFSIAAAAEKNDAKLVVFLSTQMYASDVNEAVGGANEDLILNALSWEVDNTSGITIHAKELTSEYLTVTDSSASVLAIVMVVVVPLAFLATGLMTVIVRRRRKRA